jgi:hypothetical protein
MDIDMQHGHQHAASIDMNKKYGHGHAPWTWTCTMNMDMDVHPGHGMDMYHGQWTCTMDNGQAALTWSFSTDMDMQNEHRQQDFLTKMEVPHLSYSAQRSLASLAPSI